MVTGMTLEEAVAAGRVWTVRYRHGAPRLVECRVHSFTDGGRRDAGLRLHGRDTDVTAYGADVAILLRKCAATAPQAEAVWAAHYRDLAEIDVARCRRRVEEAAAEHQRGPTPRTERVLADAEARLALATSAARAPVRVEAWLPLGLDNRGDTGV